MKEFGSSILMDKKNITRKDKQKAKRLKSVRNRNQLTQEKMAERLDVSYSTYQRMESGRNNITIAHLEKLNKEFGVSADYILFGKVADRKHYELEFECSNNETKFLTIIHLVARLCKLDRNQYEDLLTNIEKEFK